MLLRLTAVLLLSTLMLAAQAPPKTQAVQPPPSLDQIEETFCADNRPEIQAFCQKLRDVMAGVRANPVPRDQAARDANKDAILTQHRVELSFVNPSDINARPFVLSAIAKSLALRAATASLSNTAGLLQAANQLRTDQQLGPAATAPGTTSLVAKAGSATLMSFGLDTGVLTRTVNGSTATLTANADELFRLISGSDAEICTSNCGNQGFGHKYLLNPLSFAPTFALAQSSASTTPTSGQASGTTANNISSVSIPSGAGKLSSFTAKYQFLNRFDPRDSKFADQWTAKVQSLAPVAITAGNSIQAVYEELQKDTNFKAAFNTSEQDDLVLLYAAADDPSGKRLLDAFESLWLRVMQTALNDPDLSALVAKAMQDQTAYRRSWNAAVASVVGTMVSAQYTFNKPLNQPETHDFTFILAQSFKDHGTLTFNGTVSVYQGTLPAGAQYGRVHYGQFSTEYDRNVTSVQNTYQWQFNIAGYWQYQPNSSVLNIPAGTVAPGTTIPLPNGTQEFVGTAGSLWVTQAGFTVKGPNGVNIPVGVSWSNKTDLLRGTKVGGQFGISYNFSSIKGLF
jgi:hypothetical protein